MMSGETGRMPPVTTKSGVFSSTPILEVVLLYYEHLPGKGHPLTDPFRNTNRWF